MVSDTASVHYSDVYVRFWRHSRYLYRRASPAVVLYGGTAVLELFCRGLDRTGVSPRLIVPLSIVVSSIVKMGIQFGLFLFIYLYYIVGGYSPVLNAYAFLLPLLILILAGLGLGFGLLISSLTTKYRDLRFLVTFGVQLWMYATPVIYPLSVMQQDHRQYMWLILANPLTAVIETFKFGFLGEGTFSWWYLGYSFFFLAVVMLLGMITFNKVQRSFMDVI